MKTSRRTFLGNTALGIGALTALGLQKSAFASRFIRASANGNVASYKALVCIDLDGGNDGNNTIIPMSSNGYSTYCAGRQQLALAQGRILPVGDGRSGAYGFHPSLSNFHKRYLAGMGAVVANVGPLLAPIDRPSFLAQSKPIPSYLLDHELQRAEWGTSFSLVQPSAPVQSGWGGRIADLLAAQNTSAFPLVTSLVGANPFTPGISTVAATISTTASAGFPADGSGDDLQLIANLGSGSKLVASAAGGLKDAIAQSDLISAALGSAASLKTVFPNTTIGAQLNQVAKVMSVRASLGMNRQIFLCQQPFFDTHGDQLNPHANLLSQLDGALEAFMQALTELGLLEEVTLFTQSDFGRSMTMNSAGGSDHAWGNHQLVLGGAVQGNALYGRFPDLTLGGPDDISAAGVWIPTTSVEQYASPLASWFGVPDQALAVVFPNISAFKSNAIPLFG